MAAIIFQPFGVEHLSSRFGGNPVDDISVTLE